VTNAQRKVVIDQDDSHRNREPAVARRPDHDHKEGSMKAPAALRIFAAALALGALAAAPAGAAIQHEFSGSFTAQYVMSNFNNTAVTKNYAYEPDGLPADPRTANFFEQRVRLGYTAKVDERLKFVSKFEIDYAYYGDSSYGVGANHGAALGADQVNLETKNLYLDYTCPITNINAKVGMQEYVDSFEGILLWADAAGVSLARPFGAANLSLGFFRLFDNGDIPGKKTADLLAFDGTYQLAEKTKIGAAYYLVSDNRDDAKLTVHTLGVNARTALGPATVNGYVLTQFGDAGEGKDISAYAANAGLELPLGPGTLRSEFCYNSGDSNPNDNKVKSLQTYYGEYWYGSHGLALLTRDDFGLTADNGVVYDVAFAGRGSMIASAGYDLPLGAKTAVSVNLGEGWAAKGYGHAGSALGTETNVKLTQQLYEGLTLTLRGAYLFLGKFYDGVAEGGATPDNPWDARIVLAYSF
jgi:hypothetical protein